MKNILMRIAAVSCGLLIMQLVYAGCAWSLTCFSGTGDCTSTTPCGTVSTYGTNQLPCYTNTGYTPNHCCVCVYHVDTCVGGGTQRVAERFEVSNSICIIASGHCGNGCVGWSPPGGGA